MDIFKIVCSTFASLISLFTLTKITGNRQMSQLSMFDYVSSVAIGSIAGEMAVLSTGSVILPLVSMMIFAGSSYLISYITCKSIVLRRFFEGQAILLYQNGTVYEKNLLKVKLDMDELLSECRLSGYFDLEEIHTIYLENNGQISILPMSASRPAAPSDLNLNPDQTIPLPNIIIDGKILKDNMIYIGKNEKWVEMQVKSQGIVNRKDIMLATYDQNKDRLNFYLKHGKKMLMDIFE